MENSNAIQSPSTPSDASEDKGSTFRKRRLSLTKLSEYKGEKANPASAAADDVDDDPFDFLQNASGVDSSAPNVTDKPTLSTEEQDEKAHSFRKRRLSLTHMSEEAEGQQTQEDDKEVNEYEVGLNDDERPSKRINLNATRRRKSRTYSDVSASSSTGTAPSTKLKSRTVHAAELLAHPPPSPSVHRIYVQKSAPPQRSTSLDYLGNALGEGKTDNGDTQTENDASNSNVFGSFDEVIPLHVLRNPPKWVQRHTRRLHEDEKILPFPRDIVGTFSCHGVEPIYDQEEEEDPLGLPHKHEKPTTAAKINQDRGGVAFPYGNCARTALFAVYDGHGQGGELVAQFALHEVQRRLEKHPKFTSDIAQAFQDTFIRVDEALKKEDLIEPYYAGTTACVALLRENTLVLANAGDSRAVLARKKVSPEKQPPEYEAIDLTIDQNPDLPAEQSRIEQMGGYVSPPPEPGLSARVWLDAECTQIGLAMARSIGDHAVKEVGVIAEPVVTTHDVQADEDDFVIFATDGVWEFVSSEEAVQVVASNLENGKGATRACQALIETAAAKWHEEEGDYRDDITALVVRLPELWKTSAVEATSTSK